MQLPILAAPDCPNAPVLQDKLAAVLHDRADVSVSRETITDQSEAARRSTHGSSTLLIDGADPPARPGQPPSMSCRLYRDDDGRASGAPSTPQLRTVIDQVMPHQANLVLT